MGLVRIRQAAVFLAIVASWSLTVHFKNAILIAKPLLVKSSVALTLVLVILAVLRKYAECKQICPSTQRDSPSNGKALSALG